MGSTGSSVSDFIKGLYEGGCSEGVDDAPQENLLERAVLQNLLVSTVAFTFEPEENGGLSLALQEDSTKTGKISSAGMFFLGFPVYRFDRTNYMTLAKDPDSVLFKKLDGFQPCEINELKTGTHVFAVYGDNFFRSATYTIEVLCAQAFSAEKEKLRKVEAKLLSKRAELSKFENEYREVLAQFTEMTNRYAQEMQEIDELLGQRNMIHASYTSIPHPNRSSNNGKSRTSFRASKGEGERPSKGKDSRPPQKGRNGSNLHTLKWKSESHVKLRHQSYLPFPLYYPSYPHQRKLHGVSSSAAANLWCVEASFYPLFFLLVSIGIFFLLFAVLSYESSVTTLGWQVFLFLFDFLLSSSESFPRSVRD
ncbi:hypothetical protein HPP92_010557 [Vanilla planifolia]|uniref:Uncharacterized protein n=1 Tax=Vanilla planifolia TaxID=51239 RepID=A0A835R2L6_VANPL|nr:hypothetical protein HPP92_010557 [Vanilla planifolia]